MSRDVDLSLQNPNNVSEQINEFMENNRYTHNGSRAKTNSKMEKEKDINAIQREKIDKM